VSVKSYCERSWAFGHLDVMDEGCVLFLFFSHVLDSRYFSFSSLAVVRTVLARLLFLSSHITGLSFFVLSVFRITFFFSPMFLLYI